MTDDYRDIINLPAPVSKRHPPMPMNDRAAQFLPYRALTGHEDALQETARLTEDASELEEDSLMELDRKLAILRDRLPEQPRVVFTVFFPDSRKSGGAFRRVEGSVKKLDEFARTLTLTDGTVLPLDRIPDMESEIFDGPEG